MRVEVFVILILFITPISARAQSEQQSEALDQAKLLLQLESMEQHLEDAVSRGVDTLEKKLPPLLAGRVFFAGLIQVRGFYLEGYGLFFDVEYPVVRRSILWSIDSMEWLNLRMTDRLQDLRLRMQSMKEGSRREAIQKVILEIETAVQIRASTELSSDDKIGLSFIEQGKEISIDPQELYLKTLTSELTDVIIESSEIVSLRGNEWLTVAARDGRSFTNRSYWKIPHAFPHTLTLRILGADLLAIRDGKLSSEEARNRVRERMSSNLKR